MNEDFKDMRYLSQLLAKRSETYFLTIEEITDILGLLHNRLKNHLANLDPIEETLVLYEKIVRSTDAQLGDPSSPVGIDLTGADVFTIMLCIYTDASPSKMRNKLYYDLYLGVLGMVINNPEEEEIG